MKRIFPLLSLFILTIGGTGVVLYRQTSLTELTRDAEDRAEAVARAYSDLVDTQVRPLLAENLLPTRHPAVPVLTSLSAALQQSSSLPERLARISQLQLALWDLVNSAASAPEETTGTEESAVPTGEDPVAALKKSIGNRGTIADLLEAYNSAAMRWNRAQERPWFSLRARLSGTEPPRLPFLRFDGRQEFVPIIQL